MYELPADITSMLLELAKPPTIEEELEMEKAIRVALSIEDIDEVPFLQHKKRCNSYN